MPAPRDAPDRVWSVRQCVGSQLHGYPTWQHRQYQPVTYVREYRKRDRLHVWKLDAPLLDETFADKVSAIEAGRAEGRRRGIPEAEISLYALALRLSDLFPDEALRARVRLGEGGKFILAAKKSITARRGPMYSVAICTHDRQRGYTPPMSFADVAVTFLRLCGRVNEAQYEQITKFATAYGLHVLRVDTLPNKPGTIIKAGSYSYTDTASE